MPLKNTKKTVLAGDIGGTKTHLAIFAPESGVRAPLLQATFVSRNYASLEALAREFLSGVDTKVECASFGVAGPVVEGRARITNLPWVMDETQLADALDLASVQLLNDLEAIASAVPSLEVGDRAVLNRGSVARGGAIAVIAPGTGLGEAASEVRAHSLGGAGDDDLQSGELHRRRIPRRCRPVAGRRSKLPSCVRLAGISSDG